MVTVFTLVYNTGPFVIEAIKSVRENKYPNLQHIVIDDFSTDGFSTSMVENWIEQEQYKCLFIKHQQNKGVCKTLNEVLSLAKGKYIFGVSDDLIMPEKIRTQVQLLEAADDDVCLVYSDVYRINDDGFLLDRTFFEVFGRSYESLPQGKCLEDILASNFIPANSLMIKRSCIDAVGHYDESLYYEDWDMNIRLLKKFRIIKSPYISAKYRVHASSMVQSKSFKYFDSSLITEFKNIGIDRRIDKVLKGRMVDDVEYYFAANGPKSIYWLWRVFWKTRNLKVLVFSLCASFGMKYHSIMEQYKKNTLLSS